MKTTAIYLCLQAWCLQRIRNATTSCNIGKIHMSIENTKKHDIVQRKFDGRWVVWSMIDSPFADLDWHRKSGLPIPQVWVPVYVGYTEDEARRASRRSRI
jgi:hypothetical protein